MKSILTQFRLRGTPLAWERYGNGHINQTFRVQTSEASYILQKINRAVFTDVPALMRNILSVTRHLASKVGDDPRRVLTIVETLDGLPFFQNPQGEYWRVYDFVTDSLCLERAETRQDFRQSGLAFGAFQRQLSDFPAETLHETIPAFHDTPARYAQLSAAVREDACGRAAQVRAELDFAGARETEAATMVRLAREGKLPLRVTHNDTKLNNVLLDIATREALCVIDLDTVMPGLAGNDFGDSIRFGASTAAEDEPDLSRVQLSLPMYHAYAGGFLEACGDSLTQAEIQTLPLGAKLMTLECGVRFLTDYLKGDVYFHTTRPGQNLDRARTQFKLVADMEAQWDAMQMPD